MPGKRASGSAISGGGPVVMRSAILATCMLLGSAAGLRAQATGTVSGSPLDTIMSTRFWTDVPEAKGFVQRTRPDPETLDYRTPYATEDARPRPRSATEVEALTRELESADAQNRARAVTAAPLPAPPSRPAKAR
jgi:hypothetical protein